MNRLRVMAFVVPVLLASGTARADEDEDRPKKVRHPDEYVDLELTFISVGAGYARHLGQGIYVGAGFSVLPPFLLSTYRGTPFEIAGAQIFVRAEPATFLQIDVGARTSKFEGLCLVWCSDTRTGSLNGPYASVDVGWRHFKVGSRVEIAQRSDNAEWGVIAFPLLMRIEMTP